MNVSGGVHGPTVRALREKLGVSQERLAARAGLAMQTISRIETGKVKVSHPLTIKAIADALDVNPYVLVRK
jgi:transcriptional regulator with XRE-family HTH domain